MSLPEDLKFTKDHEWVKIEGNICCMGITDFAQDELGELVYVELPKIDTIVSKGATLCVVESTKAASDVYAPLTGKVIAVNVTLNDSPSLVNEQPFVDGWLVKLELHDPQEFTSLLSADDYRALIS